MNEFKDCTFEFQTVRIDQGRYKDCLFKSCTIEYGGEGPISLVGCTFNDCNWKLVGAARNTIAFLRAMYTGMGDFGIAMVDHTVDSIRAAPSKK